MQRRSTLGILFSAVSVLAAALVAAGAGALPAVAAPAAMVTAGDGFSCGLMPDQSVWCWGRNTTGQLGNGSDTDSLVPVPVSTLPAATGISAGHDHVCAVNQGGQVWCWGSDAFGELGDGTASVQSEFPELVLGVTATQVSAGDGDTCAVTVAQTVDCWGDNNYGELGDGSTADASTPQPVTGLTGVVQVAVGYFHACALTVSGAVWCWGDNSGGDLGDGKKGGSDIPVLAHLENAVSIAAGDSDSCAIISGGDLVCWGGNAVGQLGTGNTLKHTTPAQVIGVTSGAEQVTLGEDFGCAILNVAGPAAFCWGDSGGYGKLGNGQFSADIPAPVQVFGLSTSPAGLPTGPAQLSAGTNHACVLLLSGPVDCWGEGVYGATGDGSTLNRAIPAPVIGLPSASVYSVSAGTVTGCAVTTGLTALCWGQDTGDGSPLAAIHTSAVAVVGLPAAGVSQVSAAFGGCAVVLNGGLATGADCWGDNSSGELGNNTTTDATKPVKVKSLSAVQSVTTGGRSACAVAHKGEVLCWGSNSNGQLGDGTTTDRHTPVAVTGLPGPAAQVEAGGRHTCALITDGTVWCWGKGGNGELGNGSASDSATPVEVTGLANAVQIAIGGTLISGNSSCALTGAGQVFCWGWNASGQLGDGTTSDADVPEQVSGLSGAAVSIVNNGGTACATLVGGSVQCWGDNSADELGNGATGGMSLFPVTVAGFTALGTSISSENAASTCAVSNSGQAECWGWNTDGQLGDGSTSDSPVPVAVQGL
jgi:alpha-tubulin suppressor-like RCC1 family protein